jgi:hypothetical protein
MNYGMLSSSMEKVREWHGINVLPEEIVKEKLKTCQAILDNLCVCELTENGRKWIIGYMEILKKQNGTNINNP